MINPYNISSWNEIYMVKIGIKQAFFHGFREMVVAWKLFQIVRLTIFYHTQN